MFNKNYVWKTWTLISLISTPLIRTHEILWKQRKSNEIYSALTLCWERAVFRRSVKVEWNFSPVIARVRSLTCHCLVPGGHWQGVTCYLLPCLFIRGQGTTLMLIWYLSFSSQIWAFFCQVWKILKVLPSLWPCYGLVHYWEYWAACLGVLMTDITCCSGAWPIVIAAVVASISHKKMAHLGTF